MTLRRRTLLVFATLMLAPALLAGDAVLVWTLFLELLFFAVLEPAARSWTHRRRPDSAGIDRPGDSIAEAARLGNADPGGTPALPEPASQAGRDGPGLLDQALSGLAGRRQIDAQVQHSQKMEAIGRLAGGVAHDFNNLLTIILGYVDVLREQSSGSTPLREAAEAIGDAAQRGSTLTRQLLAFSRRQVAAREVIDLNETVSNVEQMVRRLIGADISLTLSRDPGLGRVKADSSQIEQVLMNLVVNARDAMPEGGHLSIETANADLDANHGEPRTDMQPGRYVLLAVSDTGHGMNEETREHIFEPFFTTKEAGKGTGLGLAMVYGIVTQSAGQLRVSSAPGSGTTFRLYFPRVEAEVRSSVERRAFEQIPRGSETVLIAEDEVGVRQLLREVLDRLGYTVLLAQDAEEALLVCERYPGPIHLLLTDVVMPGLNGRALAERVVPMRAELKTLFMSGYTDHEVQRSLIAEGAPFVQKPFTPEAIARKVREALDRQQSFPAAAAA